MASKHKGESSSVPGLKIRGSSYWFRRMVKGEHIQRTIGRVNEMSLEEAEQLCLKLIQDVRSQGKFALDMSDARVAAGMPRVRTNQPQTLRHVANEMLEHGREFGTPKTQNKPWRRKTIEGWEAWLASDRMQLLLDQDMDQIQPSDVHDWYIADLYKGAKTATANAFKDLRRVVNWAIGQGYIKFDFTEQMAKNPRRFVPQRRGERLEVDLGEVGDFAVHLPLYQPKQTKRTHETVMHLTLLAFVTGRRIAELRSMEWGWISFQNRTITVPGEMISRNDPLTKFEGTKNRKDFTIPMARIVHTMLRHRWENKISERFVFPGKSGHKPISDHRKTQDGLLEFAGVKRITPHDFRRTFADICRIIRPDYYTNQQMLGHSSVGVTASYMGGLTINEKFGLFQDVSDYISRSMPAGIAGQEYSGRVQLKEDNRTEDDQRMMLPDALEVLMFGKIWREGEWHDLEPEDMLQFPSDLFAEEDTRL